MTLKVLNTWIPSHIEWDEAWNSCLYSTYFHSREWSEIWAEYSHGEFAPDPLGITLSDGVRVILPFTKVKLFKGLTQQHLSSPGGTFGGWLAKVSLDESHQKLVMGIILKRFPNLIWRFNPYETVKFIAGTGGLTQGETRVLDLSLDFNSIVRGWTKGHVSAAHKALKAGVGIHLAESLADWRKYFQVYEDSLKRWGNKTTSIYSWDLFETLYRRRSINIKLWLAAYRGDVVAGALCFYSPSHVVYWHGAVLSSHFELRPVNLLIYEAIRDASARGSKWFDFNPSGELEGVLAFKRSFGAKQLPCDVFVHTSPATKALSKIANIKLFKPL